MEHYFFNKFKRSEISVASILLVLVLLVPACARQPQPARIEEITFQSGEFESPRATIPPEYLNVDWSRRFMT